MIGLRPKPKPSSRRGVVYLAVLGVTMIVAVIALTSMSVARLERRIAGDASDLREARLLARSAVEFGVSYLSQTNDWRTNISHDTEDATRALGSGTFTWKVTDADGDLSDDPTDNVTLTGYGRVGDCVAADSVVLQPAARALDSLEFGLYSNAGMTLPGGSFISGPTKVDSNGTVAFNGAVNAEASRTEIGADAWSTGSITGSVSGVSFPNESPAREMPGSDAFDYYTARGTPIDIAALPLVGGNPTLQRVVLSPVSNPFGDTNPEGVYVIECGGQRLNLQGIRVVGTLVILNPGPGSRCPSVIRIENHVPNYPALLIDGDFSLQTGQFGIEDLGEWFWKMSFNPPGTPYEGEADTDDSDTFPATITGLVYVSGTVNITDHSTVTGGLIAGRLAVTATCELTANYADTYLNYPPPGFRTSEEMEIIPGTWRRATAP